MHWAGYTLDEISRLTFDQRAFVCHVAFEMLKMKAKIAGAEIKEPSRHAPGDDSYGDILKRNGYKDLQAKFAERMKQTANKPL